MRQDIRSMKDKQPLSTREIFGRIKSERAVYAGSGKYKTILARKVIWEMLDFLIEKVNFPVEELIDEVLSFWGEELFEHEFEHAVLRAIIADKMVEDGLENHNFPTRPDPVTGRVYVPLSSSVWRMHRQKEPRKIKLPKITYKLGRARAIQYNGDYKNYFCNRCIIVPLKH